MSNPGQKPVLVVGAGIAGVTAALEAAEAGQEVILVEREPAIGGRVLRLHNYFPKLCPPACGMEINTRRLEKNPRIRVLTQASVARSQKTATGWQVTIERAAQFVTERCTACGDCAKVCPAKVKDTFNLGMCETSAVHLPHAEAWPRRFVLERSACPAGCKRCVEACKYQAIDLDAKPNVEIVEASAVVAATGWHPYPLEKLEALGGGRLPNVIANVQLERLVAASGPTQGKILRPSDQQPAKRVAFVQCAGSRDMNHLPYCSAVCCLASLKQAIYIKEQIADAEVTIYYIDRRTPGRNEEMLTKVAALAGVKLVKGKVGKIEAAPDGSLKLFVEDAEASTMLDTRADLVVLATGMVPNRDEGTGGLNLKRDDDGFGLDSFEDRLFIAGVLRHPEDVAASVRDATGAAAKAMASATRSA
jgi:quinone-modifying oxidoreductase subunit QmoA